MNTMRDAVELNEKQADVVITRSSHDRLSMRAG
jgi:hypothetical protein